MTTDDTNIYEYNLSARQAAKLANMTAPTLLRHAKKRPDLLPWIEIAVGTRSIFLFNPKHIDAYLKHHLVNSIKGDGRITKAEKIQARILAMH